MFAQVVAPTMVGPLPRRRSVRDAVTRAHGAQLWDDLVERPIGYAIEAAFADDLVRGVVATDAQIGTHASMHDEGLLANRCFAYHVIGNGTGEWRVPVGGMGAVADALVDGAKSAGAQLATGVGVTAVVESPGGVEVHPEAAAAADGITVGDRLGLPAGAGAFEAVRRHPRAHQADLSQPPVADHREAVHEAVPAAGEVGIERRQDGGVEPDAGRGGVPGYPCGPFFAGDSPRCGFTQGAERARSTEGRKQ